MVSIIVMIQVLINIILAIRTRKFAINNEILLIMLSICRQGSGWIN